MKHQALQFRFKSEWKDLRKVKTVKRQKSLSTERESKNKYLDRFRFSMLILKNKCEGGKNRQ